MLLKENTTMEPKQHQSLNEAIRQVSRQSDGIVGVIPRKKSSKRI